MSQIHTTAFYKNNQWFKAGHVQNSWNNTYIIHCQTQINSKSAEARSIITALKPIFKRAVFRKVSFQFQESKWLEKFNNDFGQLSVSLLKAKNLTAQDSLKDKEKHQFIEPESEFKIKCHLLEKYNTASSQILQPSRTTEAKSTMEKEGESTALLAIRLSFWLCHQQTVRLRASYFASSCLGLLNKVLANWIQYQTKKDHTHTITWHSSCKLTRMVQHMQTNQCDTSHKQKTKTTWSSQ